MNANLFSTLTAPAPLFSSPRVETGVEEIMLDRKEVRSLRGPAGRTIRALEGTLWITEEGDSEDYLIESGETFTFTGRGRVVVESLAPVSRFVFGRSRA